MLWAVLSDFRALKRFHILTTLDCRIGPQRPNLPADEVRLVQAGQCEPIFTAMLARSDAVLIIAPETDGILERLSRMVAEHEVPLLGSSASAVKIAGNKEACARLLLQAGLPTPPTRKTKISQIRKAAEDFGYPLVTKPLDGVGSEGVCLLKSPADLDPAVEILQHQTKHAEILLQKYVPGEHASVSLLVSGQDVLPISLNGQEIRAGCPFSYQGGVIPLKHPLQDRAFENAVQAVRLIPGLQGYVGVDLVLDEEEAWVIEINPRITTSFIGLRRVLDISLAEAIFQASTNGTLPERVQLRGQIRFKKFEIKMEGN